MGGQHEEASQAEDLDPATLGAPLAPSRGPPQHCSQGGRRAFPRSGSLSTCHCPACRGAWIQGGERRAVGQQHRGGPAGKVAPLPP